MPIHNTTLHNATLKCYLVVFIFRFLNQGICILTKLANVWVGGQHYNTRTLLELGTYDGFINPPFCSAILITKAM
jgi:hypothetical protein